MMREFSFEKLQAFVLKYERVISPITLLTGFTIDSLTLRRVDLLPETLLLYGYLTVCGVSILLMHMAESGGLRKGIQDVVRPFAPVTLQFAIGGMFSAFLIFYSMSGSLARSWPFIVFLALIMIGTELFRRYHVRLVFQVSMFYLALFSFSAFTVPLILNGIGTIPFLLAGVVSLLVISAFLSILALSGFLRFRSSLRNTAIAIGAIYIAMNGLYFLNILPPIPLALKEIGMYHRVEVVAGDYVLSDEPQKWFDIFFRETLRIQPGERAYAFSSVFAPVDFNTEIVHRWERWESSNGDWETSTLISFPVSGGRDSGYRGFSFKESVSPGLWRVSVETPRGALIGRTTFVIEFVEENETLVETRSIM